MRKFFKALFLKSLSFTSLASVKFFVGLSLALFISLLRQPARAAWEWTYQYPDRLQGIRLDYKQANIRFQSAGLQHLDIFKNLSQDAKKELFGVFQPLEFTLDPSGEFLSSKPVDENQQEAFWGNFPPLEAANPLWEKSFGNVSPKSAHNSEAAPDLDAWLEEQLGRHQEAWQKGCPWGWVVGLQIQGDNPYCVACLRLVPESTLIPGLAPGATRLLLWVALPQAQSKEFLLALKEFFKYWTQYLRLHNQALSRRSDGIKNSDLNKVLAFRLFSSKVFSQLQVNPQYPLQGDPYPTLGDESFSYFKQVNPSPLVLLLDFLGFKAASVFEGSYHRLDTGRNLRLEVRLPQSKRVMWVFEFRVLRDPMYLPGWAVSWPLDHNLIPSAPILKSDANGDPPVRFVLTSQLNLALPTDTESDDSEDLGILQPE